ncbi:MAG: NADH-quinone oxidoreductase subunit H, partial [Anaerolineae bacterium]|nr:NADH-quinone oxidoreductase subunit H [Anaerolineae bacterium]
GVLFFISSQAETGRAPFDLIEAESELVAGFNIEYSGMKFGMFFAAEFLHVFTNGVLITVLFLGGWYFPGWQMPLIAFMWLGLKAFIPYFISLWIRNTVPRLRIDQVMRFNWFFLVPLSIVNVLVLAFLVMILKEIGWVPVDETGAMALADATFIELLPMTIVLFISNVLICLPIINRLRRTGSDDRVADEQRAQHAIAHAAGD